MTPSNTSKFEQLAQAFGRWLFPRLKRLVLRHPLAASLQTLFNVTSEAVHIINEAGEGLKQGKITLLAKGESATVIETTLQDSSFLGNNEVVRLDSPEALDQATGSMVYIFVWDDWGKDEASLTKILAAKQADAAGLVVWAPKTGTPVEAADKKRLLDLPNVVIAEKLGQRLHDSIVMAMTGAYAGNTENSHEEEEDTGWRRM